MPLNESRRPRRAEGRQGLTQFTVSAVVPRLIAELLTPSREEQEAIYRQAELDPVLIDDIDNRIAHDDFCRFATVATGRRRDPHFGLNAITSFFPSVLDVVGFTMLASGTLLEALETLVKYSPIIDESIEVTLVRDVSLVTLVVKGRVGRPQPIVIDTGFAAVLQILRLLGAGRPINAHAARFSYPPPRETAIHAAVLGCSTLAFAGDDDAITFGIDDIEQPIPRASKIVSTLLTELASNELEFLKKASLASIKVREVIARGVGGTPPTLSVVAGALHMSPRALQRSLEREGVSFRELLDDTQRQHAHLRLRYSSRSIKEIAFELGFKEQRSFHRACMRWFGTSPATYRRGESRLPRSLSA